MTRPRKTVKSLSDLSVLMRVLLPEGQSAQGQPQRQSRLEFLVAELKAAQSRPREFQKIEEIWRLQSEIEEEKDGLKREQQSRQRAEDHRILQEQREARTLQALEEERHRLAETHHESELQKRIDAEANELMRHGGVRLCGECLEGSRNIVCDKCDGTGEGLPRRVSRLVMQTCNNHDSSCPRCGGIGQFQVHEEVYTRDCAHCFGRGRIKVKCIHCTGTGLVSKSGLPLDISPTLINAIRRRFANIFGA